MGRFVSLEDVARAVALLAELEQSAFVNATLRGREGRAGTGRGLLGEHWVAQAELFLRGSHSRPGLHKRGMSREQRAERPIAVIYCRPR